MPQASLILWIVAACDDYQCALTHVYALDEQNAREQAADWLLGYPHLPLHLFRPYPCGFRIDRLVLPGSIAGSGAAR